MYSYIENQQMHYVKMYFSFHIANHQHVSVVLITIIRVS